MVEAKPAGKVKTEDGVPYHQISQSIDIDQMAREKGMMIGPDDRASLLSSITAGPQVEMQHGAKSSGRD